MLGSKTFFAKCEFFSELYNIYLEAKKYYKRQGVEIDMEPEMTTEEVDFFVDEDEEDEWDWSKK